MSSVVPDGWSVYALGELGQVVGGGTPPSETLSYWGGSVMWATPAEITKLKSRYINKTLRTITKEGLQKSSAKLHPKGTILLTSRASIGYPAINSVPMATNQGFQSLRPNEKLDVEYGYQLILNNRNGLERLSAGSTFLEISSKEINKYKLPIPPLPEQKKIASILTSVDAVIDNTQKQIDKLQDLKKATMNELLTKGIGHTEFKDSELGRIPKSWEVKTVGESCVIKNTLRLPISRDEREKIRGNYRYYGPTGILDYINEYRLDGEYTLIGEDGDHFIKFYDKPQSIHVTGKFNVNNHAHILEGNAVVSARWVYWFFLHRDIGPALTRQGAGRYKLNKDSLQKLEISVPPMTEQVEINEKLKGFDTLIRSKDEKLSQTQSLKKSLMQDLLTGKVRVSVN